MNETAYKQKLDLRQWLPIALILLLATGLYLYEIGTESMWIDELYSINDAKRIFPNPGFVRPVYYILLRIWMLFGMSASWLRSLSVVFGLGTVFLTYQLGRRVSGELTGLIAALLLTVSPLFINHAQMVRMYSLSTCLAIAGSLALVYALENPNNSSMAWWAATRVLMFLTAPLNITLLLPDILIFGLNFRKQRDILLNFGKWLLLVIILWLFSVWEIVLSSASAWFFQLTIDAKQEVAKQTYPSFREVIRKFKNFTAFPYNSPSKAISLFYRFYTLILVFLLSFSLIKKHRSGKLIWIAAWAFIPGTILFLVSSPRLWNTDRYLLFLCPYLIILIAAGFLRLWSCQRTAAIVLAIIYLVGVSNGLVRYYTVPDHQNWRDVIQVINTMEKSGDRIIIDQGLGIHEEKIATSLAYYYKGTTPIYVNRRMFLKPEKKYVEEFIANLLPIERIWLLSRNDFDEQAFQNYFGTKLQLEKHWEFTNNLDFYTNDIMHLFLATPNSNIEKNNER
ncbi:glycosyltransferase family 39 protein [Dapis sp. BLCC M126]|uniref:glycosyltransferase family 39 protein n=1 Tax=Dapis sp. BLCC M126 TaxID=3400189 RepID=UPI003CEE69AC